MIDSDRILTLIDMVYAAATGTIPWARFLEQLAGTTNSAISTFLTHDLRHHRGTTFWQHGADDGLADEYARWAPKNLYLYASAPYICPGYVGNGESFVSDREILKSEYYAGHLRPLGVMHNLGAVIHLEGPLTAILFLLRGLGKPSHSDEELAMVRVLVPHVQRALAVSRQLGSIDVERRAAVEALNRLTVGVAVLDQRGAATFVNESARRILQSGDGLALDREAHLVATNVAQSNELRRLVGSTCAARIAVERSRGGVMHVSRPSGRTPFTVMIAPIPKPAFAFGTTPPAALVFVADPEESTKTPDAVLADLYALTPAEATVANALARGLRVQDVAEELAVTTNTIRTHLKRIFSKTGVRTQSELLRLLLTGPARLHLDGELPTRPR